MARKVYYVHAPKGTSEQEIRRRCQETKKRVDQEDARKLKARLEAPVFVPTQSEWKQIKRKLGHNQWLKSK